MEPDELEQYMALREQCTDITTARVDWNLSSPQEHMYPCGVKEIIALNQELSEKAGAVKIRCFKKTLKRLLKLQSRIAATGNVQPPVSGNVCNVQQC